MKQRAEEYLNQIPMWTRRKNSLEDVRSYLRELGDPDRGMKIVHVAGTNGKGSVCAYLTSVLLRAGYCTGTFISPHLEEIRERFLLNGRMVSRELFEESFDTVYQLTGRMTARGYCHPTFFEFLFYMAMVLFAGQPVDCVVLETGMGGRLDTTNVVTPVLSVITSIGLDHTQYLGDTIEAIAAEKAGIIKPGVPVVYDANREEVSAVIGARAACVGAPAYGVTREDYRIAQSSLSRGLRVELLRPERGLDGFSIPFEAPYQADNALLAVRALEMLRQECIFAWSREELTEGLSATSWPARMEEILPGVYLDGAHNPDGILAFRESAARLSARRQARAYLLFSAVSDKDCEQMIRILCQDMIWAGIGVTRLSAQRGADMDRLRAAFSRTAGCPVYAWDHADEAFNRMRDVSRDGILFCAGSLYLAGEIKGAMRNGGKHDRL